MRCHAQPLHRLQQVHEILQALRPSLASGLRHYARIEWSQERGRWLLKKAKNLPKDQSYVLYFLTQEQLAHTRFPLGEFESKEQIRSIAEQYGFVTAKKQDSQDICFVPDGDYVKFLEEHTGKTYPAGQFVNTAGEVIGTHQGAIRYTIGQRRGLGQGFNGRAYVLSKDMEKNRVVLGSNAELFSSRLIADTFNWSAIDTPTEPVRCKARHRYQSKETPCTAAVLPDGRVEIVFDEPVRALTVGQAVVLYDGDIVVGGGVIREVDR